METPRDTHGFVDLLIHFIGMKQQLILQLIDPPFPAPFSSFSDSWVCVFPVLLWRISAEHSCHQS